MLAVEKKATFVVYSRTVGKTVEMKREVEIESPRMHSNDVNMFPRKLIAFWLSSPTNSRVDGHLITCLFSPSSFCVHKERKQHSTTP